MRTSIWHWGYPLGFASRSPGPCGLRWDRSVDEPICSRFQLGSILGRHSQLSPSRPATRLRTPPLSGHEPLMLRESCDVRQHDQSRLALFPHGHVNYKPTQERGAPLGLATIPSVPPLANVPIEWNFYRENPRCGIEWFTRRREDAKGIRLEAL